jgi:hypothetical protein
MPLDLYLDDVVQLRKPHPCGSTEWRIVRLGADIGLKCLGCGHRVLLPRSTFEKRLKRFVNRAGLLPAIPLPRPPDEQPESDPPSTPAQTPPPER